MRKRYIYKVFFFILLLAIIWRPLLTVYSLRSVYFSGGYAKQYPQLKSAYDSSQYVKKKNPGIIPDETFESFAGGIFLRGLNPILIVHEHPPLGRYIIGLSIFLFDNATTLIPPLLFISFLGIFLIAKMTFNNTILALFPLLIYANEQLVLSKLDYVPLLEPIQLPFIIFTLYFFLKGLMDKKKIAVWFSLSSCMLGFVISIRFFILGIAVLTAMLGYFFLRRDFSKTFFSFLFSLPLALVVLLLSYTKTIQDGYSILQIFGVQKYIFFYHQSQLVNRFSFWDLILFNRWHTWWADQKIISDSTWHIGWPIAVVLTVVFLFFILKEKRVLNKAETVVFLWVFAYSALLSVGMATTRYFLPLLPFLYILAFDFIIHIWRRYFYEKKG